MFLLCCESCEKEWVSKTKDEICPVCKGISFVLQREVDLNEDVDWDKTTENFENHTDESKPNEPELKLKKKKKQSSNKKSSKATAKVAGSKSKPQVIKEKFLLFRKRFQIALKRQMKKRKL